MEYNITKNPAFGSIEITFNSEPSDSIRDALKTLRFRWNKAKGVWYGFTDEQTARAAIDGTSAKLDAPKPATSPAAKLDREALRKEFAKVWNERMTDYCVNSTAAVAELPNGDLLTIDKQKIEKYFCFGESGYDYEDALRMASHARTSKTYFKSENMKEFRRLLDNIEEADQEAGTVKLVIFTTHYTDQPSDCRLRGWGWRRVSEIIDDCGGSAFLSDLPGKELPNAVSPYRVATAEELAIFKAAAMDAAKAHERKVDSYLKRYGTSKVQSWTYWRDA